MEGGGWETTCLVISSTDAVILTTDAVMSTTIAVVAFVAMLSFTTVAGTDCCSMSAAARACCE